MRQFDFSGLTPELILDAVETKGVEPDGGLLPMNSYENRVFQLRDWDNQRWVVKFYRPQRWSLAQLKEEHEYALELENAEVPMVAPCVVDGESVFEHQGFLWALYPSRGGRIFEVDNLDQLEWMGRFIGRMHLVGEKRPFEHRPKLSIQEFLLDAGKTLENSSLVPQSLHLPFYTALNQLIEKTPGYWFETDTVRLHGDCHAGNILWTDNGPHFVDLDDCRQGPAIQDLWMMLSGDKNQQLAQLDALLTGYEEFAEFDHAQLRLIEVLRALRMVNYMAWLEKRWCDPAFPRTFPWFAEEKYWEGQILAIKEQLAALDEPSLCLMPAANRL